MQVELVWNWYRVVMVVEEMVVMVVESSYSVS